MSAVFAIAGDGPSMPYPVPTQLTCWVQEGISFEATLFEVHPTGVFLQTSRDDLQYTESVRVSFGSSTHPPVSFEGQVSTWVRGRGVRIEAIPETPSGLLRILEAWSEGRAAEPHPDVISQDIDPDQPRLHGLRVLVIDDDPGVLKMLRRRLVKEGCEVSVTTSPPSGLDFIETNSVDAIVMDWMLPSIPGQDLLNRIKTAHPDLPVAVLSGALFWEKAEETLESMGASMVLHKPLDFVRLVHWLEAATLGANSGRPAPW